MDVLSYTQPIDNQHAHLGIEQAVSKAVRAVFEDELRSSFKNLIDYGKPHFLDVERDVFERFIKQDGLVVLRRPITADVLMRIMYANWSSLASERGLAFLEFVLKMLYKDLWSITRLYHPWANRIEIYPQSCTMEQHPNNPNFFLTSRIFVDFEEDVDLEELIAVSPIIRKLVPAHIVPKIHAKGLDLNEDYNIGVAAISQSIQFEDLSQYRTDRKFISVGMAADFYHVIDLIDEPARHPIGVAIANKLYQVMDLS